MANVAGAIRYRVATIKYNVESTQTYDSDNKNSSSTHRSYDIIIPSREINNESKYSIKPNKILAPIKETKCLLRHNYIYSNKRIHRVRIIVSDKKSISF